MRYLPWYLLLVACSEATKPTPKPEDHPQPITLATTPKPASTMLSTAPSTASALTGKEQAKAIATAPEVESDEADAVDAVPSPTPNPGKKIATLPAAKLPLKTVLMSGPFKTRAEFCKASLADLNLRLADVDRKMMGEANEDGIYATELTEVCPKSTKSKPDEEGYDYANLIIKDEKPKEGPYQQLQLVHHENMLEFSGRGSVELLIQTKDGWFGIQLLSYAPDWQGAGGSGGNQRTVKELSITDAIPGGEKELVLVVNSTYLKGGRIGDAGFTSKDLLFVCGLNGASLPACYPPIRVSENEVTKIYNEETEELKKTINTTWKLKEPFIKDGQLVLAAESNEEKIPARIKGLFGAHPLGFP
jgi:hypothetical protein